ncbi:MAG: lysylphosphatidylglycerol synthase transmembrane domain-containing protein [Candidatus Krumholzibacteriota bacterium]
MKLPRRLTSRSFAVIGFSVALYAAVALIFGLDDIRRELAGFPGWQLWVLAALSLINYALRFWRWEVYLRALDSRIPLRESLGLYFATYVMVITPGKIGEIFKAGILREKFGVSLSRGLPVVLAERIYDFLAVLVLAAVGVFFWPGPLTGLTTGLLAAAAIPLFLALFQNRNIRTRLLGRAARSEMLSRHRVGLDESMESLSRLLGIKHSLFSLTLSTLAWLCECLGLWLVCRGLDFPVPLGEALFVYAAGTLVGSLSFLPGGLGGTEATIIWLLGTLSMPGATAAAVALLVRLFTLWLAVIIGLVFFMAFRSILFSEDEEIPEPGDTLPS